MNNILYRNYLTSGDKSAFSAPGNIRRSYKRKYSPHKINAMLGSVDSYTLHREVKRPRTYNPFFVYAKRDQLQMDLINMRHLKNYNKKITFLLVIIDCFTKYAGKILKDKTGEKTLNAIKSVFDDLSPPPRAVLCDRGKEFINRKVSGYFKEKEIHQIFPNGDNKAAIIERFNRSIQSIIYRWMTENETFRYIDILQKLVDTYNARGHRTLQYLSPNEAEKEENQTKVFNAIYTYYSQALDKRDKPKLSIGQTVRIAGEITKFRRSYKENFMEEFFKIETINERMPIPMYYLRSMDDNEMIEGGFYGSELQPVYGDIFKINKVLKKRIGKNNRKEVYVSWKGFGKEHNSWEPASSLVKEYKKK